MPKHMKSLCEHTIAEIGERYILDSFNKYYQMIQDKVDTISWETADNLCHITGKLYSYSNYSRIKRVNL